MSWIADAWRDARQGLRALRRTPGFAAAVIVVMALGIGSTTAVFSIVDSVLLRPLPYGDPAALHTLMEADSAGRLRLLSYPTFRDVEAGAGGVADLSYIRGETVLMRGDEGTLNLLGAFVSPNFFAVMQREPVAGRVFADTEARTPVAVLSLPLAQRLYGDAAAAVGRSITTPTGAYDIVGVMPAGFSFPAWADLWLPLETLPAAGIFALSQRDLHVDSDAILRLRPGVTADRAAAMLGTQIARVDALHGGTGDRYDRASVEPLTDRVLGEFDTRYVLLLASVVLVLIIACVNVAGLLLARGTARRSELAARLALGAGRARLVRQLLAETLVLAVIGGVIGVLLASVALDTLRTSGLSLMPRLNELALDDRVLGFALAATLLAALLAGMLPALRATGGSAGEALRGSARGSTGDGAVVRLRGALVVAQIALAVVLLVGAALLLRTAHELSQQDLGFDPAGVVTLRVMPPERYSAEAARLLMFERLRDELRGVSGVEAVALANHMPLTRMVMFTPVQTSRVVDADESAFAVYRTVSPEYLPLMRARVIDGSLFDDASARGGGIVINRTLARREWGDASAVGRSITVFGQAQGSAGFQQPLPGRVIGVIDDIHEFGPDADPPPAVYVPFSRNVWPNVHVVVRVTGEGSVSVPELRAAVRRVDADIPVAGPSYINEFTPLLQYLGTTTATRRFSTTVLALFAGVAVLLSLVGLFAVMAYAVAQRSREIGVRMALGARPADAARLVLRHSAVLVGVGLAVGIAAAVPATRLLEGMLFGVPRLDPVAYGATALLFLGTALLAAWLPARRAARVDPMTTLRTD